jgi:uncharacterized protein YndB with AHSA1/START domain
MRPIIVTRSIKAPVERVFQTVADIQQFSKAVPRIVKYEFLSAVKSGVGTRFRETSVMKGKEATTELEVTEHVPNEHVRMVADSHGVVWDSVFTVKPEQERTELTLAMDARAYKFLPKLMYPLMYSIIAKSIANDMDSVKKFCEQ